MNEAGLCLAGLASFTSLPCAISGQYIEMNDKKDSVLRTVIEQGPILSPILHEWHRVALPDGWLVAGAIAQTVWNHYSGFSPAHGIDDIDIVYFDASDLSEKTEAEHAARIRSIFSGLPVRIDVKNEARVHLWYEEKFGYTIRPYTSAIDAITTFPTTATAIGVRPGSNGLDVSAPYGTSDLLSLIVRPNRKQITRDIYESKVRRWASLWPGLTITGWDE